MENPVHKNADGKWYFWNDIWGEEVGPFDTKEQADEAYENRFEDEGIEDGLY